MKCHHLSKIYFPANWYCMNSPPPLPKDQLLNFGTKNQGQLACDTLMNDTCYFVICPFRLMFSAPKGFSENQQTKTNKREFPTYTLLDDGAYGKFRPSPHLQFFDGNMAGLGGLLGPLQPGCSRIQLPDPTNRYPVSVLVQLLQEHSELAVCTMEILLQQHSVHQVPVMLVYEGGGSGHLLLFFILPRGSYGASVWFFPQIRNLQPASWAMFQSLVFK